MRKRQPPPPAKAPERELSEPDARLLRLIAEGSAADVARALAEGANPNARATENSPASALAIVDSARLMNKPALLLALELGQDPESARVLLRSGADPNGAAFGATPLEVAIERRPDMGLELIDAGANIHDRSLWGPPLVSAAKHGRLDLYKALAAKGASPKDRDWKGRTAPMRAALSGELPMLERILSENLWEDGVKKPSWAEPDEPGAPPEPRACALSERADWGSRRILGAIAAELIEAARAIRAERFEQKRQAKALGRPFAARTLPIEPSELYARVEASGVDLMGLSAQALREQDPGASPEAKAAGDRKAREWMAHALSTHPSWRLEGEALARRLGELSREAQAAGPIDLGAWREARRLGADRPGPPPLAL